MFITGKSILTFLVCQGCRDQAASPKGDIFNFTKPQQQQQNKFSDVIVATTRWYRYNFEEKTKGRWGFLPWSSSWLEDGESRQSNHLVFNNIRFGVFVWSSVFWIERDWFNWIFIDEIEIRCYRDFRKGCQHFPCSTEM